MNDNISLDVSLVKAGAIAGLTACLTYLLRHIVPLPSTIKMLFFFALGPLAIIAFIGLNRLIKTHRNTAALHIATLFGIIAGAFHTLMAIVQYSNVKFIREYIRQANDPAIKEEYERILQGVFTVQLGIDVSWDIFITLATVLFGVTMLKHPRFGKVLGGLGIILGLATLVLNLYTFPVPPHEAGLIDLGPAVGFWFLIVVIQMMRSIRWLKEFAKSETTSAIG